MSKFEKLKIPSHGVMPGVAFHASDVQLAANGPRVLIFGGQRQGISGAFWSFEQTSGDGFTQVGEAENAGPPPAPRTQATLTSIGPEPQTELVLFAGFALNIGCMNDLWKCTITLDDASMPVCAWTELQPTGTPPVERYGHSATRLADSGHVVVFGGQDGTTQFNDVFVLSADGGAWSSPSVSGSVPSARMKHSATAYSGSALLLCGGFSRKDRVLADAFKLELSADGGSVSYSPVAFEAPLGEKTMQPRSQHVAASTKDGRFVFFFGGYDGDKNLNDLWLLDLQGYGIRRIGLEAPVPEARSRHTAVMINDVLYLFAGYDGSKPCAADVFTLDCSDPLSIESADEAGGDKKKEKEDKKEGEEED